MRKAKTHFVLVGLLLEVALCGAGCTQQERPETTFYSNGHRKQVATWQDGHLQGRLVEYYPNGNLKATSHWLAGKRTGITRLYYPTGSLRDSSAYLSDSLNGLSLGYTAQGLPQFRSYYTNGRRTGREVVFNATGQPAELHVYDSTGRLFYVDSYEADGKPSGSGMTPLFKMKDTLKWGEKMTGYVWFGYPLKTKATLLVGTLGKDLQALDRYPMLDTIQVVKQSQDGRFYFAFYPAHTGVNSIGFKFLQPGSPWDALPRKDSLSVDHISVTSPFFVQKPNSAEKSL
jgi:hypothetical protein